MGEELLHLYPSLEGDEFLALVFLERTPQNTQNYWLNYVCDNLNQIYRFVSCLTKQF